MNIESPLLAAPRDLFTWSRPSWSSAVVAMVEMSSSSSTVSLGGTWVADVQVEIEDIAYHQ